MLRFIRLFSMLLIAISLQACEPANKPGEQFEAEDVTAPAKRLPARHHTPASTESRPKRTFLA